MDTFSGRPNRPVSQRDAAPMQTQPVATDTRARVTSVPSKKPRGKKKLFLWIVGAIVALALLAGGTWLYKTTVGSTIDSGKYQAVFLTNGQVYFGKLHRVGEYYKLSNVFYLQATQSSTDTSSNPQQAAAANSGVQLIKLGNEVHGPEDSMVIEKNQVLFFENLKNDGKVVDSINKYTNKK
jgi:hypothetical protein